MNNNDLNLSELLEKYQGAETPNYYSNKTRSKKNDPIKTAINQLLDQNVNDNTIVHILINEFNLDAVKAKQRVAAARAIRTINARYGSVKNLLQQKKEQ